jgi:DNA-directed RNA polymerase omega subunit
MEPKFGLFASCGKSFLQNLFDYLNSCLMARITTEDCLKNKKIESHFELVLLASRRARSIESGDAPKLDLHKNRSSTTNIGMSNNAHAKINSAFTFDSHIFLEEKSAVLALREIAKDLIDLDLIKKQISNESFHQLFSQDAKVLEENEFESSVGEEFLKEDIDLDDSFYITSDGQIDIEESSEEDLSDDK